MTKPRILVVDDDPNITGLVRLFLEKTQRFEVCVENRSALALSVALEFRPDLIILDLNMPHLDGLAVMQQLSTVIPRETFLPVLVLTADATAETK